MQLLLPTLAAFACLMATAQGFLVPFAAKPTALAPTTPLAISSSPSAAEAAMLSTNPLAGRSVQFSDSEDSDERVTQVRLNPDGSISLISCNTQAVDIKGNWRPGDGDKVGFILERIYPGSGDGTYSLTRIYEGHVSIKSNAVLGEGKIEMEKYSDLITVGFFSIVSINDERDDIDKLGGGHAVLQGVDQ